MEYGRKVIRVKDVRASSRAAFGQDAGSMRNPLPRALLLASLTALMSVTAACCKCTQPAVTPAAVPAQAQAQAQQEETRTQTQAATAQSAASTSASGQASGAAAAGASGESGSRPATKEACAACQGKWGRHGLAEAESCLCRTKDGGRPCLDGAECQGQCVARDGDFVVVEKGPPPRGHYKGKCSEFDTTFGCHRFVPRGARKKGPLPAEDAADQLCYD
jgi:hypothetical protein